ncbi:uncharacterized protein [Drosophila pseudoobscura]|uniref:Uncharacterized protein n=1 Tax=Drosophila pseudoobscura pseudoobscura TaxID=46245 RepID=A0A6I8VQV7_DROPS|nr:uncharacterized protein LOC6898538 [Drosophila pseudoobscura]
MATSKSSLLISLIVFGFAVSGVSCKVEFTNLKCTTLDREFLEFDKCFLKSINRTYKYLSVSTKIHMLPLKSVSVRRLLHLVFDRSHHTVPFQIQTQVLQRLNGYKPFLFNFTTDGCKALSGKMNPTTRFFFGLIAPYSNLNHSCPYDVSFCHTSLHSIDGVSYIFHSTTYLWRSFRLALWTSNSPKFCRSRRVITA